MEYDDKYRMVEDEFLTVAKRFTVHLHAAEYKRQQKMVKSRNADTINSISRPVTGKMPAHTKRRTEAVARAKTQKAALEGALGKKAEDASDDSDDGDGLPYFGTTLHGLMDSPRKKAASLEDLVQLQQPREPQRDSNSLRRNRNLTETDSKNHHSLKSHSVLQRQLSPETTFQPSHLKTMMTLTPQFQLQS